MIAEANGQVHRLGYASFVGRSEPGFRSWLKRLEADIAETAKGPNPRLPELQHALVDLIRELDPPEPALLGRRAPEGVEPALSRSFSGSRQG